MASKPFDLFAEYAKFGAQKGLSLQAPETATAFGSHVRTEVDRALSDPALIHGQRAEAMFESLLVSLSDFRLLKPEDIGRIHPRDTFLVPDFRVVLADGRQWLIEVKNAYIDDASISAQKRRLMTREYREKLEAFAEATSGELMLAVFWAKWSIWTLVSPQKLTDSNGDVRLNLRDALMANELGTLGDRVIGTRPPTRLRLVADPERTSPVARDGKVLVTIGSVASFCGEDEITDEIEQRIVWLFMQHGEWAESEPRVELEGNILKSIEIWWEPIEQKNEGFETIGTLSRMFTRYFAEMTADQGDVIQVHAPMRPGWFSPLISPDFKSTSLPLWRFAVEPNYAAINAAE